jgi:trehalose monomycolate/heme transporter
MLTGLGGFLYRARWAILVLTIILTCCMGIYGLGVFNAEGSASLNDPNSESIRAQTLLNNTFSSQDAQSESLILLLSDGNRKVTDPAFEQAVNTLIDKLKNRPEITATSSYYSTHSSAFVSRDQRETFVLFTVSTKDGEATVYNRLTPLITSPSLHIDIGGSIASDVQFDQQLKHDLEFGELISLPIVAVLLVLIFGGFVAAMLPLIIGGFAILGSFAILNVLTHFTTVSNFATNVITIIALGLSIDYSLFIVTRFREELLKNNGAVQKSLQRTMATSGRTVLFSGLTVCTSLLSLLVFPQDVLKTIGMATIASAMVAMLGSIFVLPVILSLLGQRINALSIQRLLRGKRQQSVSDFGAKQGAWYRLSYFVMKWSIPIALGCILLLLFLGTPFLHISFAATDSRSLPLTISARTVSDQLTENFPDQDNTTITIATQTHGDALSSDNLTKLNDYVNLLKKQSHVSSVTSVVSLVPGLTLAQYQQLYAHPALNPQLTKAAQQLAKNNVTQITVVATLDQNSTQAKNLVTQIRALHAPAGLSPLVGGTTAQNMDQLTSLGASLPKAGTVMVIAIFVLLFLMTGSVIMPLKAIILNTLSLSATFGALVWIFQDGHLQNLLGFKAFGALDSTQPILIFAIAFGLSMDYEVFLLSRIKEQFDRTGDNREAVAIGLQRTGWLITSAALLLAIVVGAFATSRIIFIQELGLGIALAILVDATLVRALLVPAMMTMLGKWNWWAPRPLRWLWMKVGLRESLEDEPEEKVSLDASQELLSV